MMLRHHVVSEYMVYLVYTPSVYNCCVHSTNLWPSPDPGVRTRTYWPAQPAITTHSLGVLNCRNLLLTVLEARSSRSTSSRFGFWRGVFPAVDKCLLIFFPSFIEVWLINKNCTYLSCTMWFLKSIQHYDLIHMKESESVSHSVVSDSLQPHGL